MSKEFIDDNLQSQIEALSKKYEAMGQSLSSYLDGLLYSDYLTYWEYIHLDTLLSLQNPRTDFPDEEIFILYHQITELYFKLILNEMGQICSSGQKDADFFLQRINRIQRYFEHLVNSFDIMIDGMDPDQFLKFRMSLLPASGFQSVQYRQMEIHATSFHLLAVPEKRAQLDANDIVNIYDYLYWRRGATELATGKKTLTLGQFEKKYRITLIALAKRLQGMTLRARYLEFYQGNSIIEEALKKLDHVINVSWPLVHMRSAARYLQQDQEVIKATGGTNWQKYLPPRKQQIVFFPELWSAEELNNWGRNFQL